MKEEIETLLNETINFPQDSRRNNDLVKLLKQLNRDESLEILMKMVEKGFPLLPIAKKILSTRQFAEPYFVKGLELADASTIRDWLEFAIPKIGLKRVIIILKIKPIRND